jgi:hypothetical protein
MNRSMITNISIITVINGNADKLRFPGFFKCSEHAILLGCGILADLFCEAILCEPALRFVALPVLKMR